MGEAVRIRRVMNDRHKPVDYALEITEPAIIDVPGFWLYLRRAEKVLGIRYRDIPHIVGDEVVHTVIVKASNADVLKQFYRELLFAFRAKETPCADDVAQVD